MSNNNTSRLRASCERCRGQKLRCIPSLDTDSNAPCQRCIKANVADFCVFRSRSQTQRPPCPRTTSQGMPRSAVRSIELGIPGTNLFSLSTTFSPNAITETSNVESASSSSSMQNGSPALSMEESRPPSSLSISTDMMPVDWGQFPQEIVTNPYQWNETSFANTLNSAPSAKSGSQSTHSVSTSSRTFTLENPSTSSFWAWDMFPKEQGARLDDMLTQDHSDPLVDLTNLLAEMSPYEQQLSRLSLHEGISHYPIGDALFFSHLFRAILTSRQGSTISNLGTPTVLLALSCFLTLNRIYSAIFRYLKESLLQGSNKITSPDGLADFRSYRGLRLGQLHQVCFRSEGELIKTVVSMLLESLGAAEDCLDLPSGVRVTNVVRKSMSEGRNLRSSGLNEEDRNSQTHGSSSTIKIRALDETVASQSKELLKEIKLVIELLKDRG